MRYVDDTFVILDKSETTKFFEYINQVDENIKFTQEECKDNTFAFLDCSVSIGDGGTLRTNVYRKPTHTDHYLQFTSHHPLIHKLGVIRTLFYRADTIPSDPLLVNEEKDHIKSALHKCGNPEWSFKKATNKTEPREPSHTKPQSSDAKNRKVRVTIPYVAGVSERLKKAFKLTNIEVSLKPTGHIRNHLAQVKDKTPKEKRSHLVYGVRCGYDGCNETYVGETTIYKGTFHSVHQA